MAKNFTKLIAATQLHLCKCVWWRKIHSTWQDEILS